MVFAHGTGGSYRSHVREEVAGVLATSAPKFAVLGIDQVEHGLGVGLGGHAVALLQAHEAADRPGHPDEQRVAALLPVGVGVGQQVDRVRRLGVF